jgi:predicted dehydrogenase
MGKAHSNAWARVSEFFSPELEPELRLVVGRDLKGAKDLARRFGWASASDDWRSVLKRPDIQIVDVSTPGNLHKVMAIEALKAGKHVLCEKPLANNLAEAKAMLAAAKAAKARFGARAMTVFNYRFIPAVQLARQLIQSGKLGRIYHWRSAYLQDWIVDPDFPYVWRFDKAKAGSGALGDLAAHSIDLARFLVGEIREVAGQTETFIKERRLPSGRGKARVTVDDAAIFMARFENGALGSFEVSRFAAGRKNSNGFEINGEHGSLSFNLEDMNRLQYYERRAPENLRGFKNILVTEAGHPYAGNWWPAGHILGYEHTFVHQVYEFLQAIAKKTPMAPGFEDGLKCQQVLEAVQASAKKKRWARVSKP